MTDAGLHDLAQHAVAAEAADPGSTNYFLMFPEEMARFRPIIDAERVRCGIDHPDIVRARMGLSA